MSRRPLDWTRDGHDWPHRDSSRFVQAGGVRWHVQRWGQGPSLLLLHGTAASTHSWRGLAPLLAGPYTVLAPDLPGHGFSSRLPASAQSMAGMALAVQNLLHALAATPVAVVGHSAGAALMLRMALDGGLPGAQLLGLNAALWPFGGWAARLLTPMARVLAGQPLVPRLAAWRAQDHHAVQRLMATTGSQLDAQGLQWYARLLGNPGHVAGVLAMMAHWDLAQLQHELPRLDRPLHLLVASRDASVPPAQARQLASRLPQVQLHALPHLGHLAHEEAPARVGQLLLALLALSPGAGPVPAHGQGPAGGGMVAPTPSP